MTSATRRADDEGSYLRGDFRKVIFAKPRCSNDSAAAIPDAKNKIGASRVSKRLFWSPEKIAFPSRAAQIRVRKALDRPSRGAFNSARQGRGSGGFGDEENSLSGRREKPLRRVEVQLRGVVGLEARRGGTRRGDVGGKPEPYE